MEKRHQKDKKKVNKIETVKLDKLFKKKFKHLPNSEMEKIEIIKRSNQ